MRHVPFAYRFVIAAVCSLIPLAHGIAREPETASFPRLIAPTPDERHSLPHRSEATLARPGPVVARGAEGDRSIGRKYRPPVDLPAPPHTVRNGVGLGEGGVAWTLSELIQIAKLRNPTLQQAAMQMEGELGKAIQAGLYPNPTLAYVAEQIGVEGTAGEFHGGIVRQEVITGGKLRLSRAKYLERVQVAEALACAQHFRVANDVAIHFYQALAAQQKLVIREELVKVAEDAAVTAREAFSMGQANAAGIRKGNVELQTARLEKLQTENDLGQLRRHLSAVVGVDLCDRSLGELDETLFDAVRFDDALAEIWHHSPEILAAEAKLRADQITVERERVQPIPNVQIEAGAGYNFENQQGVGVAGVSLQLPLFDRNQGTVHQAQADLRRQIAEIDRVRQRLKRDLAKEYEFYLTARQHTAQFQKVILPELREIYRLVLLAYQDGRENWIEVLHAQRDYFSARLQYVDWLARLRSKEVLLHGMLLSDGLKAAEGATPPGHIDSTPKPR